MRGQLASFYISYFVTFSCPRDKLVKSLSSLMPVSTNGLINISKDCSRVMLYYLPVNTCRYSSLCIQLHMPGGLRCTPLYKLYRYVPPQRVCFLGRFGLKTGIDFDHYGLKSGMVFKGTTGAYKLICLFNSK